MTFLSFKIIVGWQSLWRLCGSCAGSAFETEQGNRQLDKEVARSQRRGMACAGGERSERPMQICGVVANSDARSSSAHAPLVGALSVDSTAHDRLR